MNLAIENERFERTLFGFWVYIMTDCVLFATLFATYAVFHTHTFSGPSARDLFSLPYALVETLSLLISSYFSGIGMLYAHGKSKKGTLIGFFFAFLFGLAFIFLELNEFYGFLVEGHSFTKSAFLSAYFTLVSTHGIHVSLGLVWIGFMMIQVRNRGLNMDIMRRLSCLSLFWHFLDIIWIFIFTFVYLMGFI